MKELEEYNPELIDKDIIVSVSKSDLLDDELKKEISAEFPEKKNHFSFLELHKKVW
jgi:GTP-binding protein